MNTLISNLSALMQSRAWAEALTGARLPSVHVVKTRERILE